MLNTLVLTLLIETHASYRGIQSSLRSLHRILIINDTADHRWPLYRRNAIFRLRWPGRRLVAIGLSLRYRIDI